MIWGDDLINNITDKNKTSAGTNNAISPEDPVPDNIAMFFYATSWRGIELGYKTSSGDVNANKDGHDALATFVKTKVNGPKGLNENLYTSMTFAMAESEDKPASEAGILHSYKTKSGEVISPVSPDIKLGGLVTVGELSKFFADNGVKVAAARYLRDGTASIITFLFEDTDPSASSKISEFTDKAKAQLEIRQNLSDPEIRFIKEVQNYYNITNKDLLKREEEAGVGQPGPDGRITTNTVGVMAHLKNGWMSIPDKDLFNIAKLSTELLQHFDYACFSGDQSDKRSPASILSKSTGIDKDVLTKVDGVLQLTDAINSNEKLTAFEKDFVLKSMQKALIGETKNEYDLSNKEKAALDIIIQEFSRDGVDLKEKLDDTKLNDLKTKLESLARKSGINYDFLKDVNKNAKGK